MEDTISSSTTWHWWVPRYDGEGAFALLCSIMKADWWGTNHCRNHETDMSSVPKLPMELCTSVVWASLQCSPLIDNLTRVSLHARLLLQLSSGRLDQLFIDMDGLLCHLCVSLNHALTSTHCCVRESWGLHSHDSCVDIIIRAPDRHRWRRWGPESASL